MENQDDADDDLSDEIDEYSATAFDSDNDNDEDDTDIENREFNQKAHRGSDNEDMNSNETESINELDDMNNSDNEGIDEDEENEDGEGIDSNLSENEDDMKGTGRKSKGFTKSYESYNEENSDNDLVDTNTGKGKTNKRMKTLMYKVKSKAGNQSNAANNNNNQHGIEFPIESEPIYCVCSEISYGQMICCDNDSCKIEWFHFECVKLNSKPKGKWYCPHCRGDNHKVMRKFANSETTSNFSYTSSYRIK